jgi:putative transposase
MGAEVGAIRRSRAQWQALLARAASSGLSVSAFCRREGISSASFYQWRKRLAGATVQELPARPAMASPAFVDLGTLGEAASADRAGWDIELELEAGVVLRLRRR